MWSMLMKTPLPAQLHVKSTLSFATESITAKVNHTGTNGPLLMNVVGPNGTSARWVDLTFNSAVGTRFERLYSRDARIVAETGWLDVLDGRIENQARFINPLSTVFMDNASTVIQPADVQLHAPGKQFDEFGSAVGLGPGRQGHGETSK